MAGNVGYTTGVWSHYTIDVTTGAITSVIGTTTTTTTGPSLNGLGLDAGAPYDVLTQPKIEAYSQNGTAEAYIDQYSLLAAAPNCSAADFVYRNQLIDSGAFNSAPGATVPFVMFPAREMGQNNHTNQFNFDITAASQYSDTAVDPGMPAAYGNDAQICATSNPQPAKAPQFSNLGSDNITDVQATGYPAQFNHPGVSELVPPVISSNAFGADAVEVRTGHDYSATWDSILAKNHPIIGTYGSDAHTGVSSSAPANYIDAPSLTLDSLMRSYFEGRMYLAPNTFSSRIVFNLDGSARPYPARYPVKVSPGVASQTVSLSIKGTSLTAGESVVWTYSNGSGATTLFTDPITTTGQDYTQTKDIPIGATFSYVRASVYKGTALVANTEPIFFQPVAGLPADKSVHVESTAAASGCACTVAVNKGISDAAWDSGALDLSLVNPAGSTVNLIGASTDAPTAVTMDGSSIAASASLTDFQNAAGDAWFYDGAKFYLQNRQASAASTISVQFAVSGPVPTTPVLTGGTSTGTSVPLSWTASTDATALAGYRVYRDGVLIASPAGLGTSYTDNDPALQQGQTYTYTVRAYDTANVQSAPSNSVAVTVPVTPLPSRPFPDAADAYVVAADNTPYGALPLLKVDSDTRTTSYLRFSVSNLSGPAVTKAVLNITPASTLSAGFIVQTANSDNWTETAVNASNEPGYGGTSIKSGPATSGTQLSIDVTKLVTTTNGVVDLALNGVSSTNLNLASKESSTKPTLTVTSGSAPVDNPPTMPTLNVPSVSGNSVALTWTASTDDIGVAGYNVRRDGALVNPTPVVATNYTDPGVAAGTHSYTVSALDTAGQESGPSTPQSVTILTGNPGPIPATADDYVGSTDTKNNGKSPLLRTTTTNAVNSYLRFPVGGLSGPITSATLKIWANSSLAAGFDIHTVADNWTETGLLPSNLPAIGTGVPVPSGPVTAGAWVSVDVTSLVTVTSGNMDFALTGRSTTNLSLASLDAPANKPQLILTTG